jgi:hypothetical protein
MKKLINIKFIILLLFAVTLINCYASLDVNEDPLAASQIVKCV